MSADKVTLALNASEGRLQAVVCKKPNAPGGRTVPELPLILSAHDWSAQSRGVEILAAGIKAALETVGLNTGCIGKIACVLGPGSFTGLRLCIATAQGLARSVGAQIGGVEYPALLARSAFLRIFGLSPFGCGDEVKRSKAVVSAKAKVATAVPACWVVTHARSNLVHVQGFELGAGQPASSQNFGRLCDITVLPPDLAADLICDCSRSRSPFIIGSGLSKNEEAWKEALPRLPEGTRLYFETHDTPSALALALEAAYANYDNRDLAPLYIRPSDAEESIASIAGNLGLDPEAARERLKTLTSLKE